MTKSLGGEGLSYSASAFVALFVEALCYGIFLLTYLLSIVILCRKRSARTSKQKLNLPLLSVSSIMFIVGTIHLILNAWRGFHAFVIAEEGPQQWLLSRGSGTADFLLKNSLYDIQVFLGDACLLWRLYMVYSRNRLILAPFLVLYISVIATGCVTIVMQALRDPKVSLFENPYLGIGVTFLTCTMVTNLGCSLLIALRIYRLQRSSQLAPSPSRSLLQVAGIILESASIYTLMMILAFAFYLSSYGEMKITVDATTQLIGITFCGIIVSVQLGFSGASLPSHHRYGHYPESSTHPSASKSIHSCNFPPFSKDDAAGSVNFDTLPGDSAMVSIPGQGMEHCEVER